MEVIRSKIITPDFGAHVERDGLYEILDRNFSRSLICITGGGGYGKTTLASSYLRSRGIPTVWYQLGQGDNNPHIFLTYLLAAFSEHFPEGTEIPTVNSSNYNEQLTLLLTALSNWSRPLAVVLDDYHMINKSEEISGIVSEIIQTASPMVTTMICSRARPSIPLIQWKARRQLCEIMMGQLAFSLQETDTFLRAFHDLRLEDGEIESIHHKTGGWAVALSLFAEAVKGKDVVVRRDFWSRLSPEQDVFEYLGAEVVGSQPPEMREFLLKSSLLHELQPDILAEYMPETGSYDYLGSLEKNYLFIHRNRNGFFQFTPIFRSFLYESLRQQGPQEIMRLHGKAARIYESKYQYYYAFAHFIAAHQFGEAARLLKKVIGWYQPEHFLYLLDGTLETLIPTFPVVSFNLFLFRCIQASTLQPLIKPLEDNIKTLEGTHPASSSLAYLKHRLGLVLFYTGDIFTAKERILQSLEISERLSEHALIPLNLSLVAQCCRFMEQYEEGVHYASRALGYSELYNVKEHLMHTFWILLELLLELGDLSRASPLLGEMVSLSDSYHDEAARVYPSVVIGKYYRLKGDFSTALDWMEKGLAEAEKSHIQVDLAWARFSIGSIYLEQNELALAKEHLEEALHDFEENRYFHEAVSNQLKKIPAARPAEQDGSSIAIPVEPPLSESKLHVNMLGPFEVHRDGHSVAIPRKSSLRVFQYLLLHFGKKVPKDILLEELFTDGDYLSRKNRLFVSVSLLRKSLEPESTGKDSKYVLHAADAYYLNTEEIELDSDSFISLVGHKPDNPEERFAVMRKAEKLYRGDLLSEYPYEPFADAERERFRRYFQQCLRELAGHYWKQQDYVAGMDVFNKLLDSEPDNEHHYFDYITMLLTAGFFNNARTIARRLEAAAQEYGDPDKERLQRLFAQFGE